MVNMSYHMQKTSLYLPAAEHEKLKEYCKGLGITMNGLIKVLLEKHMREVSEKEK